MQSELPSQISQGQGPLSRGEFVTTISHFHRAEIGRMAGWRDRIDRTTNWAITVVAAMLSLSLSTSSAHHGVLIFAMLLPSNRKLRSSFRHGRIAAPGGPGGHFGFPCRKWHAI